MITVFLVDDHEIVRRGVASLLGNDPELEVAGEAATVRQAMARIPALRPDVAVLDVRLPDGNGIELCRNLRARLPELRCLMLTSFTDEQAMVDAILAGADGYVIKDIQGLALVSAVRQVAAGRSLLDGRAARVLRDRLAAGDRMNRPLEGLTDRERRMLRLISEGMTNRQISEEMHLAEKTVKNYVSRLLAKLGTHRRTQAAVLLAKMHEENHPD
ncbi:response regulator [Amycolatopsis suaedae]|uniref:Response regulator transcription factor n=1 Tax=Amycolatopsis suaedae TaxID=2510978 RepID=A0A4Q7JBN1_9PSEU|nr:response regulator transcription factor [Amycolatopsis suaedae]RZQ64498.1 response regulator transcription factor [Amycolatopsis suaedae]